MTDKSILLPLDIRMLNGFLDPVILVDQEQTIVGYNKASADLFRAELSDLKLKEVIPKSQIEDVVTNTLDGNPGSNGEVFLPYPVARQFEFNVWRLPDLKSPAPAWASSLKQMQSRLPAPPAEARFTPCFSSVTPRQPSSRNAGSRRVRLKMPLQPELFVLTFSLQFSAVLPPQFLV